MANQKLTDLTQATTPLSGTEQVYLVQGGASRRATAQQLADVPGEWSADTVTQAEAEAGTATTRRAWTALRVAQAVAAWWAGSAAKTKLDGIASGATANATDAQLRDRSTHTGTQAASTITGLAAVATSGAYGDLSGRPTLGTAAAANTGTSAGNVPVLDGSGLVPSALLPGFVDDVLEFANVAAFPATGEAGKLYISLATNRQYRWSGSIYVEINPSPGSSDAVPEGSVNLYFTTGRGESAAASWWAGSSAKTKLDGIEAGAQVNVATDLSYDAATREVRSSTGAAVALPLVTTTAAGLMAPGDKAKLDGLQGNTRAQASVTTVGINTGATTTATITLPKSAIAIAVTSSRAGWLRLYNSAAAAVSDAARARTTDPTAASGVLLETIFSASSTITLSPPASIINAEATPSTTYTVAFTNDGATGATTLTFSYLILEA